MGFKIVVLYLWIGSDTSANFILETLMYPSFVFGLPEDGHVDGRNM
jgi:hypothetical protein